MARVRIMRRAAMMNELSAVSYSRFGTVPLFALLPR